MPSQFIFYGFDSFFVNTQWESNIENGYEFVYFFGTVVNPDFTGKRVRKLYHEYCWNKISIMVATASFVFVIFFGDWIRKKVPINLIIILLLVHLGYVIVRSYVKECRINRGY